MALLLLVSMVPSALLTLLPLCLPQFSGISMDILYAKLGVPIIRDDLDISATRTLRGIHPDDDASVRSLNGCRVTDMILRLVPNKPAFR
jgi:poly(A) polymerase